MRARIACIATVALAGTVALTPLEATAVAPAKVIVTPAQGHAGDPVFLSGSGFVPSGPVSIFLRCGSQLPARIGVARTNRLGRFAAVQLRLSRHARIGKCGFSAAAPAAPSVHTRESLFTVEPTRHPLARCAVQMCLTIQAFLVRLRSGAKGSIVISGWPGAVAHVTVARTEYGAKFRVLRLNWRGVGTMSTSIAPGLIKGLQARVFVRARLGHVTGKGQARFHVMFGNR